MVGPRKTALAEESAEVEVLFANMDKMKTLTRKIQASVNRLDASGKAVQEAVHPIYGSTQKLQVANANIDRVLDAIEKLRAPREQSDREERIIRAGPGRGDLRDYIASLDRTAIALGDLKRTNIRSNEKAVAQLAGLLKQGNKQLEDVFRGILQESSREKLQPLEYVAKSACFVISMKSYADLCRQPVPSRLARQAVHLARHQRTHLQVVRTAVAKRPFADTYTTAICGCTRRVSGKFAGQSRPGFHQHS
jgi:hypothetical protein